MCAEIAKKEFWPGILKWDLLLSTNSNYILANFTCHPWKIFVSFDLKGVWIALMWISCISANKVIEGVDKFELTLIIVEIVSFEIVDEDVRRYLVYTLELSTLIDADT